jgi:hypothetical protein
VPEDRVGRVPRRGQRIGSGRPAYDPDVRARRFDVQCLGDLVAGGQEVVKIDPTLGRPAPHAGVRKDIINKPARLVTAPGDAGLIAVGDTAGFGTEITAGMEVHPALGPPAPHTGVAAPDRCITDLLAVGNVIGTGRAARLARMEVHMLAWQ